MFDRRVFMAGLAGFGIGAPRLAADPLTNFPVPSGLVGDGVADDGPAIRAATATGRPVFLPPGRFNVSSGTIALAPGQILAGAGSSSTRLVVSHAGAQAVLSMQEQAQGADIRDLCISFSLGDISNRSLLPEYPVAIRAVNAPRFKLTRIRVEAGRVGIDMRGNSGGATLSDIELGCTQAGIIIDGSLDSVKISNFHIWPFGFSRRQMQMFATDDNIGIQCGRCDDIELNGGMIYGLPRAAVFSRTTNGRPFGSIIGVDFDHRGGLIVEDGDLRVVGSTFTLGNPNSQWLRASTGIINLSGCHFSGSLGLAGPGISFDGPVSATISSTAFTSGDGDYTLMNIRNGARVATSALTLAKAPGKTYISPAVIVEDSAAFSASSIVASDLKKGRAKFAEGQDSKLISIVGFIGPQWVIS